MIVTALVAVSFNLLFGYTGMFSFGQAAFYGLGAYATVLAMNEAGLGFYLALAGGGAGGGRGGGASSGAVLVRMEPVAFVMLTFALGALLEFAAEHSPKLTGGDSGLIASLPSGSERGGGRQRRVLRDAGSREPWCSSGCSCSCARARG